MTTRSAKNGTIAGSNRTRVTVDEHEASCLIFLATGRTRIAHADEH